MNTPTDISAGFRKATVSAFEYGWCTTDHKNGQTIREDHPRPDFCNDEPYAQSVAKLLRKMGLPQPAPEQIFRGTGHDLLFLNSHGVVLRIGPQDITSMINPAILQPLGWLEDKSVTVSVYPGIELYQSWLENKGASIEATDPRNVFSGLGQALTELHLTANRGIIRTLNESLEEEAVSVLLDPDHTMTTSHNELMMKRTLHFKEALVTFSNKADAVAETLRATFNNVAGTAPWQRAFVIHQPLRRMFWDAFKTDTLTNAAARSRFWAACARAVKNPEAVTMPVWTQVADASGRPDSKRAEIFAPQAVLYRPWTGRAEDQYVESFKVDPALKSAVAAAHAKQKPDPAPVKPSRVRAIPDRQRD